jgi:flagellar biosynthesis/type III secretory pathway protein FliH
LSKAAVNPQGQVVPFAQLLTTVKSSTSVVDKAPKLGRTAAALQQIKIEAEREGRQEGFNNGYAAGLEQGRAEGIQFAYEEASNASMVEVARFATELDQAAARIDSALREWIASAEESLTELSVLIAAKILAKELRSDDEAVRSIVRNALSEVTHASSARIRLNPFDLPKLAEHQEQLLAAASSLRGVELVPDPALAGGCVIETDGGVVDANIESALQVVLASLRGEE